MAAPKLSRALREVEVLARVHTTLAVDTLAEIAGDPSQPAAARVSASDHLLSRGWGRPQQTVVVSDVPEHMSDETLERSIEQRLAELARTHRVGAGGPAAGGDDTGAAASASARVPPGVVH